MYGILLWEGCHGSSVTGEPPPMLVSSCHFRFLLPKTFYFLLKYLSEPTSLLLYYAIDEGCCIATETFGFPKHLWLVDFDRIISHVCT